MPRKVEYKVKPETVTDFQDIYDGLLTSKDMLEKFRISGEPRPEAEAKNNAAIERILRWCKAWKIEIKT